MEWLYYPLKRISLIVLISIVCNSTASGSIAPLPFSTYVIAPVQYVPAAKTKKAGLLKTIKYYTATIAMQVKKWRISVAGKIALSVVLTLLGILAISFAIYLLAFGGASSGLLLLAGVLGIAALIFWLITRIRRLKRKQATSTSAS